MRMSFGALCPIIKEIWWMYQPIGIEEGEPGGESRKFFVGAGGDRSETAWE
jgi:hypothetical protein